MDRSMLLTRPREYLPSLVAGLVMAIAIPACAYADQFFRLPFDVAVNVWEMGDAGMGLTFPYNLRHVIRIILMAAVINLAFWVSLKVLLGRASSSARFKTAIELAAILVIIAGAAGAIYHWGFDLASSLYRAVEGYDGSVLLLYLYVNDEYVGHHLQHLAMFGYMAILVIVESKVPGGRRIHLDEGIFTAAIAGVIAVTNGYAALHSESAIVVLGVTIVMLAIQLACLASKRVDAPGSPLFVATLVANVLVIVQGVAFMLAFGLSPWYPFLRPA